MSRKSSNSHGVPKLSEIASQAKRYYIPKIEQDLPDVPARSYGYSDVTSLNTATPKTSNRRLRIAVLDADAVDIALQWNHEDSRHQAQDSAYATSPTKLRIPLIVGVDEKRAGGNWESSCVGAEENLCRRSNLVRCLARVRASPSDLPIYPIPSRGGIYSPQVVVYRCGPSGSYGAWDTSRWDWLPVISVAPGRRPKVRANIKSDTEGDSSKDSLDYIFAAERELMRDKIRTSLRLAAIWGHRDVVVGSFGMGLGFHNPPRQLSAMWKQILFEEEEFQGVFENVVFAIEHVAPAPSTTSAGSGHSKQTSTMTSSATKMGKEINQNEDNKLSPTSIDESSSTTGSNSTFSHSSNSSVGSDSSNGCNSISSSISSSYSSQEDPSSSTNPTSTSSRAATGTETCHPLSEYEIFKEEFAPKRLCKINLGHCKETWASK